MAKRVAIQGIKGSYHHQASKIFFDDEVDIVECVSFKDIPDHLNKGHVDFGVMAIENSIAGSLLQNYKLLGKYNQVIVGEVYIPIEHSLLVRQGQNIKDLEEVHSHPMAILQCEAFFEKYPYIKLVGSNDTADSAKDISEGKFKNTGAIASAIAGDIYELETLAENIQTIKNNYTRFFIIQRKTDGYIHDIEVNKASLKMSLGHETGSLAKVLSLFSVHGINLTKIQSIPVMDKPWQYTFYVDLVFPSLEVLEAVKEVLKVQTSEFVVLGVYKEWSLNTDHLSSNSIKY